jgi:hypothetical protein
MPRETDTAKSATRYDVPESNSNRRSHGSVQLFVEVVLCFPVWISTRVVLCDKAIQRTDLTIHGKVCKHGGRESFLGGRGQHPVHGRLVHAVCELSNLVPAVDN